MNQYHEFLTSGIPTAILVILIGRVIFRKMTFEHSTQWIRIILLIQVAITIITISFYLVTPSEDEGSRIASRLNGPYAFAYIFMLLTSTLLPLLLINERFGRNIWSLLIVGMLMNFGRIFESFVIITTAYHRDYGTFIPTREIETIVKGLILGVVMISFEYVVQKHDLRFIDNQLNKKVNYKPLLIMCLSGLLYSVGFWLTSIYGFDPPYQYFYSGLILERISVLVFGLLSLNFFLTIFKKKPGVMQA